MPAAGAEPAAGFRARALPSRVCSARTIGYALRMPAAFQHRVLDNGLTIIAETDPSAHSAACGFFVKTGARDESAEVMGVSHFLEHMMFKGTERITAEELNRAFDEIGARNNAYTSTEMTCFYAQSIPEHLGRAVELLARMMRPALRQSDFDTEKKVILEEIAMYKDNPFWVLYEAAVDRYYAPNPMSHRVLGTTETISALSRDQMRDYFERWYAPDNTVVALAGKVDFDASCAQLERECGSWRPSAVRHARRAPDPNQTRFELRDAKVTRGYLLALAPAPGAHDDRKYAAALLAQVLGMSDNSRLHWSLIETGLAEEAQAAFDPHDGTGDYYIYASGDPDRLEEIWSIIERETAGLIDSITPADLRRIRNKIATAATLGTERPGDRMQRLGRLWTSLGKAMPIEEELARIESITIDDLKATHAAFPIRPRTIATLLPAT